MRIDEAIKLVERVSGDHAFVCKVEADGKRVVHWVNASFCAALGYTADELVAQDLAILDGKHPDHDVVSWLSDAFAAERRFRGTLPYYRKDGSHFWGDLTLSPFQGEEDCCTFWVALIRDITPDMELRDAFKDAKKEAVMAQQRLWSAIEALPDAFVLFDAQDRIVMSNARFRDHFERSAEILKPGVTFEEILHGQVQSGYFPEAVGKEEEWVRERMSHFANPTGPLEQEISGNGFERIHEVRAPTGDTVSLRVDITELKRQQQAVERHARALSIAMDRAHMVAHTDTLTGLANRRGLDKYLRELATREAEQLEVAFLHIDLDRFKQINDTLGHAAGDYVLQEVARILRQAVRGGDYVARVGGDEFVIVTTSGNAKSVACAIADRVTEACSEPVWFEGHICHYGASVGISVAEAGASQGTLMEDADLALYEAKERGRGRAALYTPELRAAAESRKLVTDELHQALANGEIVPLFQPQVEISTGAIAGVAVVSGWQHPHRGMLRSSDFMPIAGEIGVASEIADRVLDRALEGATNLCTKGYFIPKLSFRAGARRLRALNLSERVAPLGKLPFRLAVELPNSIDFDQEYQSLAWAIDALRETGAEIELDDFGAGSASLSALFRVAPERVKVGPGILSEARENQSLGRAVLQAIGAAVEQMGVGLVANGVRTNEEAEALLAIGCETMQGALVAPPMPYEGLEAWVMAQRASRVVSAS